MPEIQKSSQEQTTTVTIESLLEKNKKLTTTQLENLKNQIWVNPIDITISNLDELKTQIWEMWNTEDVKKAINDARKQKKSPEKLSKWIDYTKILEKDWYSAISLENVMQWTNSQRLIDMKDKFEENMNDILWKYNFLDKTSKDIIKLSLANKFINSEMWKSAISISWELNWAFDSVWDLTKLLWIEKKVKEKQASPKNFEEQFKIIVNPYLSWFDEISKKIDSLWDLSSNQKQNIINNINYFRNPEEIEKWFNNNVLNQIKLENKDKVIQNQITIWNLDQLANYLSKSRQNINEVNSKMEKWDQILEKALDFAWMDWFVWDSAKSIIWFLLKIPFLWKFLSFMLWLDPENPMSDFEARLEDKKFLKSLASLWWTTDKSWKISWWEWVFKEIDFSWIQASSVKDELAKLKTLKWEQKLNDFWKNIFKEWVDLDWIKIKLELTDDIKKDSKVSSKEFKDIVKKAYDDHKNQKETKEQENINDERIKTEEKKQKEIETSMSTIKTNKEKIAIYDKILAWEYKNITNWDNIIWMYSIVDIDIIKLINSTDNSKLVSESIWNDKYNAILKKDLILLNETLLLIKDFCNEKNINSWKIKDIIWWWIKNKVNLGENKLNDLNSFILSKKEPLLKEIGENDKKYKSQEEELNKTSIANWLITKLNNINTPTKLSSWIKNISFNAESQELIIAWERYKINLNNTNLWNFKLNDIIINDNLVTLSIKNSPKNVDVQKLTVTNWIYSLIMTWKFEKEDDWKKITIEKID